MSRRRPTGQGPARLSGLFRSGFFRESISVFLRITEMLCLFVFTQFRTQNRFTLSLALL
jgi:hypothetical protein